jgi:hypothetical protein
LTPFIAAAVVQLFLGALLIAAAALSRDRARDLLIEEREVGLPVLTRERRRLVAPRRREALAGSLEDLVRCAERCDRPPPRARPVYEAALVRQVASELRAVAADLRAAGVGVCGVARVERLLTMGTSPLYGTASDDLRAEIARITAGLEKGTDRPGGGRDKPQAPGRGRSYASTSPRRIA